MARTCRRCGRDRVRQSFPKSTAESLSFWVLRRPYRCASCNSREMLWAWWWEARATSPRPTRSAATPPGFEAMAVEEVRSAIREREQKLRLSAGGTSGET